MKVAKNYELVIINKEKEICKGLWTRVQVNSYQPLGR